MGTTVGSFAVVYLNTIFAGDALMAKPHLFVAVFTALRTEPCSLSRTDFASTALRPRTLHTCAHVICIRIHHHIVRSFKSVLYRCNFSWGNNNIIGRNCWVHSDGGDDGGVLFKTDVVRDGVRTDGMGSKFVCWRRIGEWISEEVQCQHIDKL